MAALGVALALAGLRGRVAPRILAGSAGAIMLAIVAVGALRPDAVFSLNRGDSPWRLRAGNVRIALEIAHDHPLAGVGPGGFAEAFPQYRRPGDNESRHAHDLPAELAAEWGVPLGLLLSAGFFWVFVGPVVRSAGDSRSFTSGLSVGLAAFGLHNLADFTAFFPSLLTLAAVGRGLIANRTHRETASPAARAGWVLVVVAIAVAATRVGLARDALFQAREEAKAGNHEEALRFAQRAETLAPWDADPPQFAAEARMVRGDGAGALKDAERAVYRAPSRASARVVRARARAASGDSSGAYADLVEAEKLYPAHPDYAKQRDALAAAIEQARQAAPR
jgi:tetratricopeptide (TPR) repeat protein